jgi:hypothetical protein
MDLSTQVITMLREHPSVRGVVLSGSRQRDEQTLLSDWDFEVEVDDLDHFVHDLPRLVRRLNPLGQQWDRLSPIWCYQFLLPGPAKVDILVDRPHAQESPWEPNADNLKELDHHFWDWILWLGGKELRGREKFVIDELRKMSEHLLRPLAVEEVPTDIKAAVRAYRAARSGAERRFGIDLDRRIETEVRRALSEAGFEV